MIRKYLGLMLLLCCGIVVNAAKVALIPTASELAPLADQVLAAMSKDSDIEFLERTSIEAVLSERKLTASGLTGANLSELGKLIHADLFAIITAKPGKKGAAVSGLIVYDARNGFRMVNATLPEEDTVKEIVKYLRQAQDVIQHPEKQILLSVATVRDAGVPERLKYQQAFIAAELERRLGGIPNVTVLERDYLENVNLERKLTEQMFALALSSRLIRLEFSPGASPEIVNMTLRITDSTDKELFRFKHDNCLSDTEATVMKTVLSISEYLKVNPTGISLSASNEAARYFAEYQFFSRLGDYPAARRKLHAAISLDPKKLGYRLAELELYRANLSRRSFSELTEMLTLNLRLANEIKMEFPEANPYVDERIKYELFNRIGDATPEQMAVLSKWGDEYRFHCQQELKKGFNPDEGINSYTELQAYRIYCRDNSGYFLYFDNVKWCANLYKTALENLKASRDFFLKHPELCSKSGLDDQVSDWIGEFYSESSQVYDNSKGRIDIKTPVEDMILNSREYIQLALQHPLSQTKFGALRLELWQKTVKNRYNEAELKQNVLEFCRQASAIDKDLFLKSNRWNVYPPRLATNCLKLEIQADKVVREYILDNFDKSPMEALFASVTQSRDRAKIVQELAPKLLHYKKLAFTVPEARDFFYLNIAFLLCGKNKTENEAAIAAMNCEVEIAKLFSLPELSSGSTKKLILNAVWTDEYVYLLLNHKESENNSWNIVRLETNTGITAQINSESISAKFTPVFPHLQPFAVSGKTAIAAGDDCILVFPLDGGKATEIKDLPGKKVMALTILNNRIYAFAGTEERQGSSEAHETFLFSCDFKGNDRQIHISTSRDDKKNALDREKPFKVYNLVADENKKRLLFFGSGLSGGQIDGLWEFIPLTGSVRCLFSDNGGMWVINPLITVINNSVSFSFHDSHYVYDMDTDKLDLFFSIVNPAAKYYLKCQANVNSQRGSIVYHCPFFARPDQIWFGGNGEVKLLALPDVSKSPLILMPQGRIGGIYARLVFPHPDGKSAIVIDEKTIYKITPKDKGMEIR